MTEISKGYPEMRFLVQSANGRDCGERVPHQPRQDPAPESTAEQGTQERNAQSTRQGREKIVGLMKKRIQKQC